MKTTNTMFVMTIAAIAVLAIGIAFYALGEKSEKFTLYRPEPSKNTWAKDTVLTRVMSSGKLA
jgi:hypothetical protein